MQQTARVIQPLRSAVLSISRFEIRGRVTIEGKENGRRGTRAWNVWNGEKDQKVFEET